MKRTLSQTEFKKKQQAARTRRTMIQKLREAGAMAPPAAQIVPRSSTLQRGQPGSQIVRGFVGAVADAKFFDVGAATYGVSTTGSVTHLDVIPQGTTVNSREGKSFQIRNIHIQGFMDSNSTTTIALGLAYLIWDHQPNKALAAVTDILDSANSLSFLKRENKTRFQVLKKILICNVGNTTTPATGREMILVDEYVKTKHLGLVAQCTVADTTGAIGNRINGALLLVTAGNVASGTADQDLIVNIRIGFND